MLENTFDVPFQELFGVMTILSELFFEVSKC